MSPYKPPPWAGKLPAEYAGKRSIERAWHAGLEAGKAGKAERDNPYAGLYNYWRAARDAWENGRAHGVMVGPDPTVARASESV